MRHPIPRELHESGREPVFRRRVDIPIRAYYEHPALRELPREKPEQQKRRLVRCVQVVEDEHEWLHPCGGLQERCDRVEEAEAGSFGFRRGWLGQPREELPKLRDELRDLGSAVSELRAERLR